MTWKKTRYRKARAAGQTLFRKVKSRWTRGRDVPSGWKHWCRAQGLQPAGRFGDKRQWHSWISVRGRGRRWRINASGTFDMSCPYADFDRWVNSTERTFPLPKTKTELELYVRFSHQ